MSVDILTRQALIVGTVTDAISGDRPRRPVGLRVVRDDDGRSVEGLAVRMGADGNFSVSGDPVTVLPPQGIDLRMEFRTQGYQPLDLVVAFSLADLARGVDNLDHDGGTVPATVIAAGQKQRDVALLPEPVTLRGRVARADDSAVALAGSQVSITAPVALGPVATNDLGFFTLGPAPVVPVVTLTITAAGFDALTRDIRLDFRQPVNTGAFALEES